MRHLITIFLIFFYSHVYAAPNVSSVNGTFGADQSVTISGSNFGTNNLNIEWLGGKSGAIESGGDGQSFPASRNNWYDEIGDNPALFNDDFAYSYNKSLVFDSRIKSGAFGLTYDTEGDIDFAYVSFMTYFDNHGYTTGQWKMYRMMPVSSVLDRNMPQWVMFNKRNFGGGSNAEMRPQTASAYQYWFNDGALPNSGEWCRIEILLKASSDYGRADASGEIWTHRPGTSIIRIYNENNMTSYGTNDSRKWRWHVFQNYQGNGYGGFTTVWMDDIYISDTKARVEIGDNASWGNCTHREIQFPIAWSNNSIVIEVNFGTFGNGQNVYLYVVDSYGNANDQGYPIILGGSGPPDNDPVVPPSDLHIIN